MGRGKFIILCIVWSGVDVVYHVDKFFVRHKGERYRLSYGL